MLKIKTWRDPYDAGFTPTKPQVIELKEGLTVLVGCNGAGKTTLIENIKSELKEKKIACHKFDNLVNGGNDFFSSVLSGCKEFENDSLELAVTGLCSSEGENIKLNIGRQSQLYNEFIKTGYFKDKKYALGNIFRDKEKEEEKKDNIRVLLYDATDSGLSIDSIIELKILFEKIIKEAKNNGMEMYIIISANEYELCRGEQCFDVNTGKYLTFSSYNSYRNFILKSRERKEERIKKQHEWAMKKRDKEMTRYFIRKEVYEKKITEAKEKLEEAKQSGKDYWKHRRKVEDIERQWREFNRSLRFFNPKKEE